jgi:hypothetical protein
MTILPAAVRLLVINGPEREADNLLPSNAEVRNAWSHTSSLSRVFTIDLPLGPVGYMDILCGIILLISFCADKQLKTKKQIVER